MAERHHEQTSSASATILLVEDCPDIMELLEFALDGGGYRVLKASSAKQALEISACCPESIDLLVTDIALGQGASGRELAERLMTAHPALKVLLVSGVCSVSGITVAGREAELLRKPFQLTEVSKRVRHLLTVPAALPANQQRLVAGGGQRNAV